MGIVWLTTSYHPCQAASPVPRLSVHVRLALAWYDTVARHAWTSRAVGSGERYGLHDSGNFGQRTLASSVRASQDPKLGHTYRSWMTVSTPVFRLKSTS